MKNTTSQMKTLAKMVPCSVCNKNNEGKTPGLYRGTFYQLECPACLGAGGVLAEDETPLKRDDMALQLRLRLTIERNRVKKLETLLESLTPYMEAKNAAELREKVYPREHVKQRARLAKGGFGD